jgi:dihydroneopterin aldolase
LWYSQRAAPKTENHMLTQTVALEDVKCFAYHGYYPEEQLTGSHFLVSISVNFVHIGDTEDLQQTVNYEVLNSIIVNEMKRTQKMLETVVRNMINQVVEDFPFISSAEVGIKKLNPPMEGQIGHSFVKLSYLAEKPKEPIGFLINPL